MAPKRRDITMLEIATEAWQLRREVERRLAKLDLLTATIEAERRRLTRMLAILDDTFAGEQILDRQEYTIRR